MSIRYTSDQLQRKFPGPAGSPGYARVADGLRAEGRLDEAIGLCQEGLRARPLLSGYVVLGKALVDAGRLDEAREQFEAALRIDPRCLAAMHNLARIMAKLQWAEAAAGYYRSILEVEPWDAEIRALLDQSGSGDVAAAPAAAPEDTFHKPEGFEGDVMEVNLNDVADEFLPSGDADAALEDALSVPSETAPADYSRAPAEVPAQEAAGSQGPETLGESAPAPISGQDVEDRLDSIFGAEEPATASATATWTAAPASLDGPPEASATATGELRAADIGEAPAPGGIQPFDLATPPEAETPADSDDFSAVDGANAPGEPAVFAEESSRVQGEDIERRLDELFNLAESPEPTQAPAAGPAPFSASDLPVAPAPKVGEAVRLGEAVAFGAAPRPEAAAPRAASADVIAPPEEADIVTGQDVADKLDNLFGLETAAPSAAPEARTEAVPEAPVEAEPAPAPEAAAAEPVGEATVFAEPKPWKPDAEEPPAPPASEALLSTESMLPPGWFGDAGDGPRVTGADVEAQLDKLFNLEPGPEAAAPPAAQGNVEGTVTFVEPEPAAEIPPSEDPDRTMELPAMKEPAAPREAGPGEKARLKESVADWLARRDEPPAPSPAMGDTLILPNEETGLADAGLDLPSAEKAAEEAFGTLAPEDMPALSETTSIEMVDGGDVAQRLDQLFAEAGPKAPSEMPLFSDEASAAAEAGGTLEVPVSGADVSARLG
jgi:hypothetical protein